LLNLFSTCSGAKSLLFDRTSNQKTTANKLSSSKERAPFLKAFDQSRANTSLSRTRDSAKRGLDTLKNFVVKKSIIKNIETRNQSLENSKAQITHFKTTSKNLKIEVKGTHQVRFAGEKKGQREAPSTVSSVKNSVALKSSKSLATLNGLHQKTKSINTFSASNLLQKKAPKPGQKGSAKARKEGSQLKSCKGGKKGGKPLQTSRNEQAVPGLNNVRCLLSLDRPRHKPSPSIQLPKGSSKTLLNLAAANFNRNRYAEARILTSHSRSTSRHSFQDQQARLLSGHSKKASKKAPLFA